MESYLSDRKQQIKIGNVVSSWTEIKKGVPQGSIVGPFLFNVFINDIFYLIKNCDLYSYAYDNTLIYWFCFNCMQANPNKFRTIGVWKRTHERSPTFKFGSIEITCDEEVKLLGVDIDFKLSFENHISNLCKKAAKQLNVLKRIEKKLSRLNKLSIFHIFILSNFSFCPLTWHFCSDGRTKKMEKVQERALRFVYEDFSSSYDDLLQKKLVYQVYTSKNENYLLSFLKF